MDEENKINKEDEKDKGLNEQNKLKVKQLGQATDDAGPSRFTPLPGEIPQTQKSIHQPITGKSKSEHSLRQFITTQDVANALKLSSLSFTPTNETIKNINFKDLKIPNLTKTENTDRCEPATFLDLKKFVASCFTKDTENLALVEVPNVQNVHTAISSIITEPTPEIQRFQSPPTQVIDVVNVTNEVRVPNANLIDIKQSKTIEGYKKKTSGNLSEKSDFGLAARDSLSSIGSNVCRICMTKGRER